MSHSITPFRRFARWLAPLVGLMLTTGVLAIGTHQHHGDTTPHYHCAVCSASHSTSIETGPLHAPCIPPSRGQRVAAPTTTFRTFAATVPQGRAPPAV